LDLQTFDSLLPIGTVILSKRIMFNDWDDDDLNLDEIFGKSQTGSQHNVGASRLPPDVENPSFQISSSLAPSRASTSRSLAEQSVNVPKTSTSFVELNSKDEFCLSSSKGSLSSSGANKKSVDTPYINSIVQSEWRSNSDIPPNVRTRPSDLSLIHNQSVPDAQNRTPQPPPPSQHRNKPLYDTTTTPIPPHPPQRPASERKRSSSPPPSNKSKRRRSRFPGPAGRLGADDNNDDNDIEDDEINRRKNLALDPSTPATPPDVDGECLLTLHRLIDSYARLHPNAKGLLTSVASLDWLSQDLVYGSSLPDERVPLLAVAIKAIQLSPHTTVLRLRDFDGNEMNGIVWNAKVQEQLAEKLLPGTSLLLKDASAGYATRALISQYVLLSQKTIAAAAFVDAESQIQLFVNSTVEIIEGDFQRLKSIVEKSATERSATSDNVAQKSKPSPSLFRSEFGKKGSPASTSNAPLSRCSSENSSISITSNNSSIVRQDSATFTSIASSQRNPAFAAPPPPPNSSKEKQSSSFTYTKPSTSKPPASRLNSTNEKSTTSSLNFDLGCDIDEETLSQMLDDDF